MAKKQAKPKKQATASKPKSVTKKVTRRASKRRAAGESQTQETALPSRYSWNKSKPVAQMMLRERRASAEHKMAMEAYYKYGRGILKTLTPYGVVGLSYGPRFKNDQPTDEMTIRVHVRTEEAKQLLKKNAKQWGLRKTYGGVGTDIVVWDFKSSAGPVSKDGEGQVHPNGTRIERENEFGTLGTKVVVRLSDGNFKGMWITAAHVAADRREDLQAPMNIVHNGSVIGSVSKADYFREGRYDVALIEPIPPISFSTSVRQIVDVFDSDKGASVTKEGATTGHTDGVIKELHYDGTLFSPANPFEQLFDHLLIEGPIEGTVRKKFALRGDSGACVVKSNGSFIGIVRGAFEESGIGVVTRMTVAVNNARSFEL